MFLEPTLNEVRLALANQNAQRDGDDHGAVHCEVTASMMLLMGLELEEQQ